MVKRCESDFDIRNSKLLFVVGGLSTLKGT